MSRARTPPSDDEDAPDPEDPRDAVDEHRDLFERIADSDLPVSNACERALEELDDDGGDDSAE